MFHKGKSKKSETERERDLKRKIGLSVVDGLI